MSHLNNKLKNLIMITFKLTMTSITTNKTFHVNSCSIIY